MKGYVSSCAPGLKSLFALILRPSSLFCRFWLILDAAATRSAIHELLGDLAAARSDVLAVLHEISPLGSEVSRVRGLIDVTGAGSEGEGEDAGAGRDQGPCILEALCGPARRTALHLAARLPLLEKDIGLTHECYRSFRRCIGGVVLCVQNIASITQIIYINS